MPCSWPICRACLPVAAGARRIDVVHTGVLSRSDGPPGTANALPVLEHVGAQGDRGDADLVAERDGLPRDDLASNLAVQCAGLAVPGGVDQGGDVIGRVQDDASWHDVEYSYIG